MKNTPRRDFVRSVSVGLGALGWISAARAAEKAPKPAAPSLAGKSRMRLGMVTYNLGKDWDVPTIIRNCTEAKFEGVELRTTHRHGVEVTLGKAERAEVRKRFADSPVALASLGSAFDYHTADPAKLRRDIEATKEYIVLARDVGATGVKVRPNGVSKELGLDRTLEQIGRSLRELGEFAAGHGQQIRLEVHGNPTSQVPYCRRIMDVASHPQVGVCWNCNETDLAGEGFDANFALLKSRIFTVHMRDLFWEEYPFRRLLNGLNQGGFTGFCFAEIPESSDPLRVMKYHRALWLAYQGLL
jgi:sugar phosphate isomerase/epimerase